MPLITQSECHVAPQLLLEPFLRRRKRNAECRASVKLERGAYSVLPIFLLLISFSHSTSAQQDIHVRFLDFKSGRPIKQLNITVTAFNEYGSRGSVAKTSILFRTSLKTDKEGQIIIHVEDPPPNHIRIWADLTESVPDFSPAQVLNSGVVIPYRRDGAASKLRVSANPGEILIINKSVTAWDRMRQEIP
jgi:hypothetical protein